MAVVVGGSVSRVTILGSRFLRSERRGKEEERGGLEVVTGARITMLADVGRGAREGCGRGLRCVWCGCSWSLIVSKRLEGSGQRVLAGNAGTRGRPGAGASWESLRAESPVVTPAGRPAR
jgi:hypothetical protein